MENLTLLVMAAGMGSRYGGLKQLDRVGPEGETIIDYSVYDAIRAGFNKVVFIIRKEFENDFKTIVSGKYSNKIDIEFAFQELNDVPIGFVCPDNRIKPWGTGHAVLSGSEFINESFVVINGDDFYGFDTFKIIADYYKNGGNTFSMVAFELGRTLSDFGSVTRGLCTVTSNYLETVIETGNLERNDYGIISSDRGTKLNGTELVSMNVWGFTSDLFSHLNQMFNDFMKQKSNELKSEFLIPEVVNELIQKKIKKVFVLKTSSEWFGVTYKEDKPIVIQKIKDLIDKGAYPKKLF